MALMSLLVDIKTVCTLLSPGGAVSRLVACLYELSLSVWKYVPVCLFVRLDVCGVIRPSSIRPSVHPSGCMFVRLDVCVLVRVDVCVLVRLDVCVCLDVCVPVRLDVCLLVHVDVCVFVRLSVPMYVSVWVCVCLSGCRCACPTGCMCGNVSLSIWVYVSTFLTHQGQ